MGTTWLRVKKKKQKQIQLSRRMLVRRTRLHPALRIFPKETLTTFLMSHLVQRTWQFALEARLRCAWECVLERQLVCMEPVSRAARTVVLKQRDSGGQEHFCFNSVEFCN